MKSGVCEPLRKTGLLKIRLKNWLEKVMGQLASCLYANGRRKGNREELTEELMNNRQE